MLAQQVNSKIKDKNYVRLILRANYGEVIQGIKNLSAATKIEFGKMGAVERYI
jgi:hypothetical protein